MKRNYKEKMLELQKRICKEGLDVMLITSEHSIYYLTGAACVPVERPFFIIVKKEGNPQLVVPKMEYEHMCKVEDFGTIAYYEEFPAKEGECWYDKLNFLLSDVNVLGIESSFDAGNVDKLMVSEVRVSTCVEDNRVVKFADEIEAIRYSAKYSEEGIRLLHQGLHEGQTVLESYGVTGKLQMKAIGSIEDYEPISNEFRVLAWPAPKSAQPHSVPDMNMKMGKGPIVLLSTNTVQGYASECERTVFLSEPTKRESELFNHMLKCREIVFSMIRPGVKCEDIDIAVREYLASMGLEQYILHRSGHGFGMSIHERPWISVGGTDVLEENMVISVEPAIYINDIGGFRHSDIVLVTKDGYELLTDYPTDLKSLS